MRVCIRCEESKSIDSFVKPKPGYQSNVCRDCRNASRRPLTRAENIKRRYGLSEEEYDALLLAQDGLCPGCGVTLSTLPSKFVHVDHDHETGRVRGILCSLCNNALGMVRDNPDILMALAQYVAPRPPVVVL